MKELVGLVPVKMRPVGFEYPKLFLSVFESGFRDLTPWVIMEGESLADHQSDCAQRYPARNLVLFAHRIDCDEVACWDLDAGGVALVHYFASPGWEQRGEGRVLPNFAAWLRRAMEDLIEEHESLVESDGT